MKYTEIENKLVSMIEAGAFSAQGGRFYSERQLAEEFHVSRSTARRAIQDLHRQGYLLPIHGKGTFVKSKTYSIPVYSVIQYIRNYENMGLHPSARVVYCQVAEAAEDVAANLRIAPHDPVLILKKVFSADRMITNESISWMPVRRFPGIENADFSVASTTDVLRKMFGACARKTENYIEAVLPPDEIAENLCISSATPIMLFESITWGTHEGEYTPLEYFRSYYKTDVFRFSFTLDHDDAY